MKDFMNHEEVCYLGVSMDWVFNFNTKRETRRPQNLKGQCQSVILAEPNRRR